MKCVALFFLLIVAIAYKTCGQNNLKLQIALSQLPHTLVKIEIEKSSLGFFDSVTDTVTKIDTLFHYESHILEPEFLKITLFWNTGEVTSTSLWVDSLTYQFTIGNDLTPILATSKSKIITQIEGIEAQLDEYKQRLATLLNNVNYENKKISDVENRIEFIKDSIDKAIEQNIYKENVLIQLSSPVGLYSLCKYAERPYDRQRFRFQIGEIEDLFNKLDSNIQQLPSAKALMAKLSKSKQMEVGHLLNDVTLLDTVGKAFKISDFRGKYVLVDFWASWCSPCRSESPMLLNAFKRYHQCGFEIIGITIDEKIKTRNWIKAIKEDHIGIWTQLNDFNNLAKQTYDIEFIPTNFLIDPNGVIIGRDLRGEQVDIELKRIFKL